MLQQDTQPQQLDFTRQAESVIRHTQSREVSVLQPLVQAFFFSGLPACALVAAFCIWQKLDLTSTMLLMFVAFWIAFTADGRSRMSWTRTLIKNMADTIQLPQFIQPEEEQESTTPRGERLDRLARMLIERHYIEGKPTDRDTCQREKICTQPDWNEVNDLLKKLNIKGEKGFIAPDIGRALVLYGAVRVVGDNIWIKKNKDGTSQERY